MLQWLNTMSNAVKITYFNYVNGDHEIQCLFKVFGRALQIIICSSAVENSQKDTFTWYTVAQLERTGEAGEISLMAYDPEWAMAINIKKTVIQRK